MERVFGRFAPYSYALFRIVFGFMFLMHGTQKLLNFPASANGAAAPTGMPYIAGYIEIACGTLIMIGLFTSLAAFIASGMMAVAYFTVHQPSGLLPRTNGGELAVAYCFAFLFVAARGSGVWSVDSAVRQDAATTSY